MKHYKLILHELELFGEAPTVGLLVDQITNHMFVSAQVEFDEPFIRVNSILYPNTQIGFDALSFFIDAIMDKCPQYDSLVMPLEILWDADITDDYYVFEEGIYAIITRRR